ncbi:unnamed protein product [Phytomonas sp. Hart1]|nr:unnamed protein product [Phytomonas sp. Hart1]|eukprot:CCW69981.1 unnamed protein product [Phytomonas sp. isolate Hart1]
MSSHADALPVAEARPAIVRLLKRHQVVVIVGETGSGKTTQIPQYVWDDVVSTYPAEKRGLVGCTQPRRVAAVSIARHVAKQRQGTLGAEVGYAVRFDDVCTDATRIKYLTDGILLREIQTDPDLEKYSYIILDEAHERTLHGDILFGLLKAIVRRRGKALKIVVMSATLNAEQFRAFWWNAPIGVVHGRTFPVSILHTLEPQADYVEASVSAILQIHLNEEPGDVLCFLTGQEEIEDAKRILENRVKLLQEDVQGFVVLTLYSAMPYELQLRVFDVAPSGRRKIILATNIAETSITVEGIKYIVDSGVVKAKYYNSKTGIEALVEVDISRAQALQRSGRAGRMSVGKCFRLYTAEAFEALQVDTTPEIRRSSLVSVVLHMKSLGIDDILNFEFMDPPRASSVVKAEEMLLLLQALDKHGKITRLGKRLTDFPIDPTSAKTLLAAKSIGVARDAVAVVALTNTENLFLTSHEFRDRADRCKASFAKAAGDHATLLSIYQTFCRTLEKDRRVWCETNGINYKQMLKAEDIKTQLSAILLAQGEDDDELFQKNGVVSSNGVQNAKKPDLSSSSKSITLSKRLREEDKGDDGATELNLSAPQDSLEMGDIDNGSSSVAPMSNSEAGHGRQKWRDYELLRRALCAGFFLNTAYFDAKIGMYKTVVGQQAVHLHPSSVLFSHRKKPALVIFNSVVWTNKCYMKDVSVVYEEWLSETASSFFIPAS